MKGGTLLVSRAVNLHSQFKQQLEALGFTNVSVTAAEKDGLNIIINELKPRLVIFESGFYYSATPYMMAMLKRKYPYLNFAAVSVYNYPADIAMLFIINGIQSYVNYYDGIDEFFHGLDDVREGKSYVSASVQERMNIRRELPHPAVELSERQIEVLRLLCNGFTSDEIADVLHVCKRTVEFHKAELFNNLGTRNENELIRVALILGFIKLEELNFYGGTFSIKPKPTKEIIKRRKLW
jgi:DNA-binding NarL/FixJ family response regulator